MDGLLGSKHFVELGHVEDVLGDLGLELGRVFFFKHFLGVQVLEPGVVQDLVETALATQSLIWLLLQASINEILALLCHVDAVLLSVREVNWLRFDQLVHFSVAGLTCVEGWEANDHFVSQDTKGPPINLICVSYFLQDFRRQIFWSSAERVSLLILLQDFCETEIC